MTLAAAGDPQAFQVVYEHTVIEVHRFIARRVAENDVEDLVADTFVRAFRRAEDWSDLGSPVIAWLLTIARNVIKNHVAKTSRRRAKQPHLADERTVLSQEEIVIDADEFERILDSLSTLPDSDQAVLRLRFIEGLPAPSVGQMLDLSAGAVRTATYRALKALRIDFVQRGGVIVS